MVSNKNYAAPPHYRFPEATKASPICPTCLVPCFLVKNALSPTWPRIQPGADWRLFLRDDTGPYWAWRSIFIPCNYLFAIDKVVEDDRGPAKKMGRVGSGCQSVPG